MKTSILFLCILALTSTVFAQTDKKEKPLKKPNDIGVADFDSFKNTSFDILTNADRLKADTKRIDDAVRQYPTMTGLSVERIKGDYNAVKRLKVETTELTNKIPELDNQGKQLVENAKNVTPKLKSIDAVGNTKDSIKALDKAKVSLNDTATLLDTNLKIITDELKARGEKLD
jgi:hypothetical protein